MRMNSPMGHRRGRRQDATGLGNSAISWTVALAGFAPGLSGCVRPEVRNGPLERIDPHTGYRFDALRKGEGNTDEVFVCLCFSGGGTRAAALSYGVLKALRDTPLGRAGGHNASRNLLQEVDLISSVSGGSFTAASYALDRERIFDGAFEERFLKRNVQSRLMQAALCPRNLLLLPYIALDRTDLAAEFYDREVFDRRTYRELIDQGERPYLVVNATNVSLGQRFEFTQDDFDLLGSDLGTLPVGYAVAASSAFPLLLSPLRLKYHSGPACAAALEKTLAWRGTRMEQSRRYRWATSLVPETMPGEPTRCFLDDRNHQYLFLLDGGLSDNLGVASLLEDMAEGRFRAMIERRRIRHFVVILVDASKEYPVQIEHRPQSPGMLATAARSGDILLYNQTQSLTGITRFILQDFVERTREIYDRCNETLAECCPDRPTVGPDSDEHVRTYLIEVNFHRIADPQRRKTFLNMPTSLFLSDRAVDALIAVGRELVVENQEFQRLLMDLSAATDGTSSP